jgi:hypothetical protein
METDLADALTAWQGGPLPADREDFLLNRLREDAAFRAAFTDLVWTLALTRVAPAPEPRWLELQDALGFREGAAPAPASPSAGDLDASLLQQVRRQPLRFVHVGWRWAAFGAMAAALLVAGTALVPLLFPPPPVPETTTTARPEPLGPPLAVLLRAGDAVWDTAAGPALGSALSAGPLKLLTGQASLMFTNGVILHLEGPAELDLLTADRILCRAGRLRLRVPPGAEGFCIETPGGAVTDLGTELGVSVDNRGETRVAVFEGEAEASLQIPGQDGVRTELLGAQKSVRLIPTTGEIVASDTEGFLPSAELAIPPLHLSPAYTTTILAAKPALYWRLNRLESDATLVPEETGTGPALLLAGGARPSPAARPGQPTVHFAGKKAPGALYAATPWEAPGSSRAIEFWFAGDTSELMSLAAVTTGTAPRDHLELVELAIRRPGAPQRPGVVRHLTRWPAGATGGINIYSAPTCLPYRWHHVVAQQDQGKMELYLNGTLAGTAQADAFVAGILCRLQFGCLRYESSMSLDTIVRPFSGSLAEIAIYPRPLSAEEIITHARLIQR